MNISARILARLAVITLSFLFVLSPARAEKGYTVAVSYFDNSSGQKSFDYLSKGLADMLITDLSKISSLHVVEREKLELLLKEIKLNKSAYFDKGTALQLGKGLGAGYLLTGSFVLVGEELRLDARLLNVETSEIIMADSVQGLKKDFFTIEKKLAGKIVENLKVRPRREEAYALLAPETKSFEAFGKYSAGLDSMDKKDYGEAQKQLKQAIQLDSGYDKAFDALEKTIKALQKDVADVKTKTTKIEDSLELKLDPKDAREHYSNALVYQKRGDVDKALKSYLAYFESKENFIDPVQNFSDLIRETYGEEALETRLKSIYAKYPSRILEIFIEGFPIVPTFRSVKINCATQGSNKNCRDGFKGIYVDFEQDKPWPYVKLRALEHKYPDLFAPIAFVKAVVEIDGSGVDPRFSQSLGGDERNLVSVIDSGRLNPYVIDRKFLSLWRAKANNFRY